MGQSLTSVSGSARLWTTTTTGGTMRWHFVRLNGPNGICSESVTAASHSIEGSFIAFYDDDSTLVAVFSAHTVLSITA